MVVLVPVGLYQEEGNQYQSDSSFVLMIPSSTPVNGQTETPKAKICNSLIIEIDQS
jgi:hypothetical protein